jgi:hypothetical protein
MEILKVRACREADWLYAQFRESGTPMTVLTEKLSIEINAKNVEIQKFLHDHPEKIKPELVFAHLPPLLVESFRDRLSRIPLVYQEAIAAVELASRIVYGKVHRIEEEVDAVLATIRKKR